jgi:hypothetical protein
MIRHQGRLLEGDNAILATDSYRSFESDKRLAFEQRVLVNMITFETTINGVTEIIGCYCHWGPTGWARMNLDCSRRKAE